MELLNYLFEKSFMLESELNFSKIKQNFEFESEPLKNSRKRKKEKKFTRILTLHKSYCSRPAILHHCIFIPVALCK